MRLTTITVGRTYNTGNYTSQRFELSADLESDDDYADAMEAVADKLDYHAQRIMQRQKAKSKGDDDDGIPF